MSESEALAELLRVVKEFIYTARAHGALPLPATESAMFAAGSQMVEAVHVIEEKYPQGRPLEKEGGGK